MTDRTRLRFAIEVVGLSAVIASLGFVGMEIRQNTAAVRSATTQAVSDQAMELTLSIATDEHLPRLVSEMHSGLTRSELDPQDRQENLYAQVRSGVLDPAALRNVSFSFYQNPYVRELWAEIRDTFNPEFTGYWDEIVAEP
jgi:hypothetical protein